MRNSPFQMVETPIDVRLEVPFRSIVKVLLAALLTWAVLKLWPECAFILIAVLLAVSLHPLVEWLIERAAAGLCVTDADMIPFHDRAIRKRGLLPSRFLARAPSD